MKDVTALKSRRRKKEKSKRKKKQSSPKALKLRCCCCCCCVVVGSCKCRFVFYKQKVKKNQKNTKTLDYLRSAYMIFVSIEANIAIMSLFGENESVLVRPHVTKDSFSLLSG